MPDDNAARQDSLIAAHHTRLQALLDGDLETLATVVGEDLRFVSAFGKVQTRPDVFAAFESGTLKIERMNSSDIGTRLYGDIGILIYKADTRTIDGDTVIEGMTRSTTVYAFRDGGWQLISQHQSRIE
jgi:hypothetical protein